MTRVEGASDLLEVQRRSRRVGPNHVSSLGRVKEGWMNPSEPHRTPESPERTETRSQRNPRRRTSTRTPAREMEVRGAKEDPEDWS